MQVDQVDRISVKQLVNMLNDESPPLVADVRSWPPYYAGHIPCAVKVCGFKELAAEVPPDQLIVAYCDMQRPSKVLKQYASEGFALRAAQLGCEVVILDGGLPAWKNAGLPVANNLGALERSRRPLPREARLQAARTATLEDWFHNVGTSDDGSPWAANLDGCAWSLSAQALEAAGVTPGGVLVVDSIAFHWPKVGPGWPNNVVAAGQVLQLPARPGATRLGLLGLSTQGSCTGQGQIGYADGSTEPFTLSLPDWVTGERDGLPLGVQVAIRMPRWNSLPPGMRVALYMPQAGPTNVQTMVFAAIVPLRSDKTAVTLTLPRRGDGQAEQHIFALALAGAER